MRSNTRSRKLARACRFDGVRVIPQARYEGFQIRDVAADSDFLHLEEPALDLQLKCKQTRRRGAVFFDLTLSALTKADRAVTLVYAIPVDADDLRWLKHPRETVKVVRGREYMEAASFKNEVIKTTVAAGPGLENLGAVYYTMDAVGANGRVSRYPFAAVANPQHGTAIGIDMSRPAFYRVGYNAATEELFIAYDIGLTPEKPEARLRFCRFTFDPELEFRGALARFYEIFPEHFRCRTPEQGLWMPFASIRGIPGWQDFGFKFKEGHGEQKWEHAHGIISFRYSEPFTWWMPIPLDLPHTHESALQEAKRLAAEGDPMARALSTSVSHDQKGEPDVRVLNPAWCRHGAVWGMTSLPKIKGKITDFKLKWNRKLRDELYRPKRGTAIGGEYIDSSEGYITAVLDFRRDHFAAADTALTFSLHGHKPAIFRGLMAFEYIRAIARDVHRLGKLMMANSTPGGFPWLAPLLDVMGTETNWNHQGKWSPPAEADMLYSRAMAKGKPYCYLMNTPFNQFSHRMVEKYMKRCLAYGMFPGFFSHNAMEDAYFGRTDLYERDRPLFKKYVPLCQKVGEAGWEPVTLAQSDTECVRLERFGDRYLTVFNHGSRRRTVTITLAGLAHRRSRELVTAKPVKWNEGRTSLTLGGEDVAVIKLR